MQHATPGQTNTVSVDMVSKSTGGAIDTGTVNAYLKAITGDNAGKWWDGSSWVESETTAGEMGYAENATWEIEVAAEAWLDGVKYRLYGKESNNLNIPISEQVITGYLLPVSTFGGDGSVTVTDSYSGGDYGYYTSGGSGVDNAVVLAYLASDYAAGKVDINYVKAKTTTDINGKWVTSLQLDPELYILYYYKQGEYGPDTLELEVS